MLPRVGNLLPWLHDNSESMDYFFLRFSASTSTPACVSLSSISNWIDHQALDINLKIGNPKCIWRQTPLDLTRDSHTQHKEPPQNVARIFPFILKAKYKTLHVKRAWAELEKFCIKTICTSFDLDSIDRARKIYTVNPTVHSIPTLHIKHTLSKSKTKLTILIMICQHYKMKF